MTPSLAEIKAAAEAAITDPHWPDPASRLRLLARDSLWLVERVEELAEALRGIQVYPGGETGMRLMAEKALARLEGE